MKIIQYHCDKSAPNYVLVKSICIDTNISTTSTLGVTDEPGNSLITMSAGGFLRINTGYAWDGPSGMLDTKKSMFVSLVHDALYQIMRVSYASKKPKIGGIDRKVFRKEADKLFMKLYRQNGANGFIGTAWTSLVYGAIRLFAKRASQKSNTKSYWGKEIFENICKAPAKGAIDCPSEPGSNT